MLLHFTTSLILANEFYTDNLHQKPFARPAPQKKYIQRVSQSGIGVRNDEMKMGKWATHTSSQYGVTELNVEHPGLANGDETMRRLWPLALR